MKTAAPPPTISPTKNKRWLAALAVTLGASAIFTAFVAGAQTPPPEIQPANISTDSLYQATTGDKPTIALALSVEFPTVGAQYRNATYSPDTAYIGYYNTEKCYTYIDNPTETPAAGKVKSDYKRFQISGNATGRKCADAFSGNFLNWASNSAIDMLRLALSGGDRTIDENGLTILQRAILPNGSPAPSCFWNSEEMFPSKSLPKGRGDFLGAIPQKMIREANAAGTNTIYVSNTLNQIFFSATSGGTCGNVVGNNLGARYQSTEPVSNAAGAASAVPPRGTVNCTANDAQSNKPHCWVDYFFKYNGIPAYDYFEVWYGEANQWNVRAWSKPAFTRNLIFRCDHTVDTSYTGEYPGSDAKRCYVKKLNSIPRKDSGNIANITPAGTTYCKPEGKGNICDPAAVLGREYPAYEVWYGNVSRWNIRTVTGAFECSWKNDAVLGKDPWSGNNKYCFVAPKGMPGAQFGSIDYKSNTQLPDDALHCIGTDKDCLLPAGTWEIWYGKDSTWNVVPAHGAFACASTNKAIQGSRDPAPGAAKNCFYRPYSGSWTPSTSKVKENPNWLNSDGFFYSRVEVCNTDSAGNLLDDRDYGIDPRGNARTLCKKYPNGKYKPQGVVQKYSDELRLAAMGYVMDQTASYSGGRFGGVLRAKMKYVGNNLYDEYGNSVNSDNSAREWDPDTGIFVENPDNDTVFKQSGVINYLNKFGRTASIKGVYKQYDPLGELYYETLNYMQGRQPSYDAVKNMDFAMYDGFPVYTDWSDIDPYAGRITTGDYSCLKANIVVIGDINTHESGFTRFPGFNDGSTGRRAYYDLANNLPDYHYWGRVVQSFEKRANMQYEDGAGVTRNTNTNPNAANPDALEPLVRVRGTSSAYNVRSSPVVGLAYWAHTHDIRPRTWTGSRNVQVLTNTISGTNVTQSARTVTIAGADKQRPGLRIRSWFFDVDENAASSGSGNTSYRRNQNQYFLAAKYGGFTSMSDAASPLPYNTYGNPFIDETTRSANNDVWQNSENPGEANSYFLQSDGMSVLSAFDKIFNQPQTAMRSIAGNAANSTSLVGGGVYQYQASFNTKDWTGDVAAYDTHKDANDATKIVTSASPTWSAATKLAETIARGETRTIVVGSQETNPSATATLFTENGIEPALRDLLDGADKNSNTATWQDRLAYLRGSKANEGSAPGQFRRRSAALGDILNSGVQYVGAPDGSVNQGKGFAAYAKAASGRQAVVYVGANDGMMHAFKASDGTEQFAYIPSWMGPKLKELTNPTYTHQLYVDATPVIADAQLDTSASSAESWKTVLVSGTGGGGKGVFALDVTDPAAFGPSKVMWEFTPQHDADMGYVLGKPRIVKMEVTKANASKKQSAVYQWFAMVPAGVNNYVAGSDGVASATGNPTIFLLALNKPAGTAWQLGTNYFKISLPFATDDAALKAADGRVLPTGIINLEAYTDGNNVVQYVAAGDLHGKLWVLDFSKFDSSGWTAGQLSRFSTGSVGNLTAYPMYRALDRNGRVQPITAAPTIMRGTTSNTYFIGFGTGKFFETQDARSTTPGNTYYALYDNGSGSAAGGTTGVEGIAGRGRLRQAIMTVDSITGEEKLAPETGFVWGRATSDSDTKRSGWFYDFPEVGERDVYDATAVPLTSVVAFSTLIPDAATQAGVCGSTGGSGANYYVDLLTAKGKRKVSQVGILGAPLVFGPVDTPEETKADSSGRRLRTIKVALGSGGSGGIDTQITSSETYAFGRLSWRSVYDYLELYNK